jgi:hypothetical protein
MTAQYDPAVIQAMADANRAGVDATHIQNAGHRDGLPAAIDAIESLSPERLQNLRDHLPN